MFGSNKARSTVSALAVLAAMTPEIVVAQEQSGSDQVGFEEIIVTARKRAENLQEVPVAMTVYSGDLLERRGLAEFSDLALANPNVRIDSATSSSEITVNVAIRGNLQNSAAPHLDPAVGIYFDDFIFARPYGITGSLIDIESVQTLKGPQGTLYGRNTTGGAILVSTKDPEVGGSISGYLQGEVGGEGTLGIRAAANLPLGDRMSLRLAGARQELDDYLKYTDGTNLGGYEGNTLRGKFLFELADSTSVKITAEYVDIDASGATAIATQPNSAKFKGNVNSTTITLPFFGDFILPVIHPATNNEAQKITSESYVLHLNHETGWGEVKFITGMRKLDGGSNLSLPEGFGATLISWPKMDSFSAELQANGAFMDERLHLTSGLYYFNEETVEITENRVYDELTLLGFPSVLLRGAMHNEMTSISGYVQANFALTEAVNLTVGGRYTDDDRDAFTDDLLVPGTLITTYSKKKSKFNYLAGLDYQFNDDVMAYFSASSGYRSGAASTLPDPGNPGFLDSIGPESVTSYEVGLKSDWLDGKLRINASAFYQDYKNYQYSSVVVDPLTGTPAVSAIASDAKIAGGELEVGVELPLEIMLSATYGYLDAEIDGGLNDGDPLPNTPDNTYSITLSKHLNSSIGDIDLLATYDHRDKTYFQVGQAANSITESRGLLNLSATYSYKSWKATAYVNNVTNEAFYNAVIYSPPVPAVLGLFGLSFSAVDRPRIAGVKLGYIF